jgi:hypothetical protein
MENDAQGEKKSTAHRTRPWRREARPLRRCAPRTSRRAPWKCRSVESLENSKNQSEFPTLSTGLGNPAKNQDAGFPHFHRAGGGLSHWQRIKHEAQTKFQLTESDHFKHYCNASVASLRP